MTKLTLLTAIITTLLITQAFTSGACGKGCATCSKSTSGEFCLLCYKKMMVSTSLTDGKCEGDAPAGCAYTGRVGSKNTCVECEIGKILVKPADASAPWTCEDSPADYKCAIGVKATVGGTTTTTCSGCANGVSLVSGKCTGTNGKTITNCQAVSVAGCLKCKGNRVILNTGSNCPDPSKDCLSEVGGLCVSCNVENGKSAYGISNTASQQCEGWRLRVDWVLGLLVGFVWIFE